MASETSSAEGETVVGHVTLDGDLIGEYAIVHKYEDGKVLVAPDLSSAAVDRRHGRRRSRSRTSRPRRSRCSRPTARE